MANELWLPVAQMPLAGVPLPMANMVRKTRPGYLGTSITQVKDLGQAYGGRAGKPIGEVVLIGADGMTPLIIAGMGECEVAEMEEIALAALEKQEKNIRDNGSPINFVKYREDNGLPPVEKFDELYRTALMDRVAKQK